MTVCPETRRKSGNNLLTAWYCSCHGLRTQRKRLSKRFVNEFANLDLYYLQVRYQKSPVEAVRYIRETLNTSLKEALTLFKEITGKTHTKYNY